MASIVRTHIQGPKDFYLGATFIPGARKRSCPAWLGLSAISLEGMAQEPGGNVVRLDLLPDIISVHVVRSRFIARQVGDEAACPRR